MPRFNPSTLRFETDPGLGPDFAGGGDPPGTDPEDAGAETPVAPEINYGEFVNTPEFGRAVGEAVYAQLGALAEQQQMGEDGEPEFDIYGDPQALQQQINATIERQVEERMARYEPAIERMEVADWQDKIEHTLREIPSVAEIDNLLPDELREQGINAGALVERTAHAYLPEMRQTYGDTQRALEASLRAAAEETLNTIKGAHAAGYAARNAELQRVSGAPAPAPLTSGPAEILDEPVDEFDALERYSSRHGLR